jgi:alkylation response protein AidB-like acyl-CoA dehydrogenase
MATEQVNIAKGLGKGVEIAEEIRTQSSANNLFAGIFTGNIPFEKVFAPWPKPSAEELKKRQKITAELTDCLLKKVDPYLIDDTASVPMDVFESLAKLGCYGLKVPEQYGGRGLSNSGYLEALSLSASWCSAIVIVLSADNTIGCKFPVMYYGTQEQKDRLLPELSKWPTGFCLTERNVGSDASKISEYAVRVRDGNGKVIGYELTGEKWYTTNGILSDHVPLAKYLAVIARIVDHPDQLKSKTRKECFGLFIVSTDSRGFDVGVRNTFIGMRGIHNSTPVFRSVFTPVGNLIGEERIDWEVQYGWQPREGSGLKIAFESLNTGRIAIAQGCIGASKQALNLTRWWANKRSQLGGPLADKELVRDKLLYGATNILAMEAMTKYASNCFDRGEDIRIEAAAVKVFASERAWQMVDNLAQTRGGRFYETWQSLSRRELTPPDEVMWTGSRPNRIFEGANEILVQLMFREGTDKYIKTAMPLISKNGSPAGKAKAIYGMARYYLKTYDNLTYLPKVDESLSGHLFFAEEKSRLLARKIILNSGKYQARLAQKQLLLDRFSRIAIYLGAMTLACSYARELNKGNQKTGDHALLADIFCRATVREVNELFRSIDNNDDEYRWQVSKQLLAGGFDEFLLNGIIPMTEEHMRGPK